MHTLTDSSTPHVSPITLAVDAMGGDLGVSAAVGGIARFAKQYNDVTFILYGNEAEIIPILSKIPQLKSRVQVRHSDAVITMDMPPKVAMRKGGNTSMGKAIEAVAQNEAQAIVSGGNTGALMSLAVLRLRRLKNIHRPAIACLWPNLSQDKHTILLDVGADIRADDSDLLQYMRMGIAYAQHGLRIATPRVGLLNVGIETHKGSKTLHLAHSLMQHEQSSGGYVFVGFVEADALSSNTVDVVVTDGFTGNIALKAAEGTARFIHQMLRQSLTDGWVRKCVALMLKPLLRSFYRRIDPRRVNGGVFLGLNGIVVKSHGSSDARGFASALQLAYQLASMNYVASLEQSLLKA